MSTMTLQPPTSQVSIPISSLQQFEETYDVVVENDLVKIVERTSRLVLSKLSSSSEKKLCIDWSNPSHFDTGIYYFVLSSEKYTKAKYVYSYDLQQKSIKCILAPLHDPHFINHYLVEFGSGFNVPGPQETDFTKWKGEGVITVYDLSQPAGSKEVNKIFVNDGGGSGWDGSIDNGMIVAFDHVKGTRLEFPLLKKV